MKIIATGQSTSPGVASVITGILLFGGAATQAQFLNEPITCADGTQNCDLVWDPIAQNYYYDCVCYDGTDSGPDCPSDGASGNGGGGAGAGGAPPGFGGAAPPGFGGGAAPAYAGGGNKNGGPFDAGTGVLMPSGPSGVPTCYGCGGGGFGGPGGPGGGGGGGGGSGGNDCPTDCPEGMPMWFVTGHNVGLFLRDKPFFYNTSRGRQVAFELHFKNTPGYNGKVDALQPAIFGVGTNWHTPWRSYLQRSHGSEGGTNVFFGFLGDGSARQYMGHVSDFASQIRLTYETNSSEWALSFPSGSKNVYGQSVTLGTNEYFFLSRKIDDHGNETQFQYTVTNDTVRLNKVIDSDNRETTFVYTNNSYYSNLISEIHGPYGLTVTLKYNAQAQLTNVTDVAQLSSSFEYGTNELISKFISPYGTNSFMYYTNGAWKALRVSELGLRNHLYLTGFDTTNVFPTGISESLALTAFVTGVFTNMFETNNFDVRNTFYWGPRQYANLPESIRTNLDAGSFNPTNLTGNSLKLGWTRHWLKSTTAGTNDIMSGVVSLERAPSPLDDGSVEGLLTWYDYANKTSRDTIAKSRQPSMVAFREPGQDWRVTYTQRNIYGKPTVITDNYFALVEVDPGFEPPDATNKWRSRTFYYADNYIDLSYTQVTYDGVTHTENTYTYNNNHQVVTHANALSETGTNEYTSGRLTKVIRPTGLVTDYAYDTNGFLTNVVDYSATTYFRTNSYIWTNGYVRTHTDRRGLTVEYVWDALGRKTKEIYPDGSGVTNVYERLDPVVTRDRLGFTNGYAYNGFGQVVRATNANHRVTTYDYCACGSLDSVTDPLNNTTSFTYDNLGRRVRTTFPGGTWQENRYNLLNQVVGLSDSAGTSITNNYAIQGLVWLREAPQGILSRIIFDPENRGTNIVDQNGLQTAQRFDDLGRVTRREHLNENFDPVSFETFEYSTRGVVRHVNQLSKQTLFGYDELRRRVVETNANLEEVRFTYSGAGDLLTLTDGKNQATTWKYDQYGRVTNKVDAATNVIFVYGYDANGRLTSRWTPAKGTTTYTYDAVGNLTQVNYPTNTDISLAYDANNRLTNMVDASGTTKFGYTAFGALLSEDGPWENDTVSYSYDNGRRRSQTSLQQMNASSWVQTYAYDPLGRMTNTASPAGVFGYTYRSGYTDAYRDNDFDFELPTAGSKVERLTLPNGAYIQNAYDVMVRLTETALLTSKVTNRHSYAYNEAHQRTRHTRTGGDYVDYTYEDIGQLKTASGKEYGGTTNRLNEQFGYRYDAAGNLQYRTNNALVQAFSVNNLNQVTNTTRSGTMTVVGTASARPTSVTVNSQTATRYEDNTFASAGFSLSDGTNTFTAIGQDNSRADTNSVNAYLPASPNFTYDLNGNTLFDGSMAFEWDDENQLTRITMTNAWKSEFTYDGKMRRRTRKEYAWRSGAWILTNEIRYVYDNNLVLQERDQNNIAQVSYTRGKDVRGSLQAGGGIGGLLARTDHAQPMIGIRQTHMFYHADGNGNITILINTQQVAVAKYVYDPFGGVLAMSGPLADLNPYRFSSKEFDTKAQLYYFLYRYYSPTSQRWQNRDPYRERGFEIVRRETRRLGNLRIPSEIVAGINLYAFVVNNPQTAVDAFGLDLVEMPPFTLPEPPEDPKPPFWPPWEPFPNCEISPWVPDWVGNDDLPGIPPWWQPPKPLYWGFTIEFSF